MSSALLPPGFPAVVDLDAKDEAEAIHLVASLLRDDPRVADFEAFVAAVFERQKLNPPLLGNGIALPHARTTAVSEIVLAAARFQRPVMIGGAEVELVLLFGAPPDRIRDYLTMTAALARHLRHGDVRDALKSAPDATAFMEKLEGA